MVFSMLTLSLLTFNLSTAANSGDNLGSAHLQAERERSGAQGFLFGLGATLFGAGYGGFIALQHTTVMSVFGMEMYGQAMGIIQGLVILPGVLGPVLMGGVRDATGDYSLAFWLVAGLFVVAAVLLAIVDLKMTRSD